jgi:hypothetical protein
MGERLIAEGAEGFARRVAIYWDTARRSEQTAPADSEDTGEAVEQVRSKPNGIARRETPPPAQPRRSDPAEPT